MTILSKIHKLQGDIKKNRYLCGPQIVVKFIFNTLFCASREFMDQSLNLINLKDWFPEFLMDKAKKILNEEAFLVK